MRCHLHCHKCPIMVKRSICIVTLFAAGACKENQKPYPERLNIEVTGFPQCLGQMVVWFGDYDIPAVTMPKWRNDHIGTMEFGPVDVVKLTHVERSLNAVTCVRALRRRPCSSPLTDVEQCTASARNDVR